MQPKNKLNLRQIICMNLDQFGDFIEGIKIHEIHECWVILCSVVPQHHKKSSERANIFTWIRRTLKACNIHHVFKSEFFITSGAFKWHLVVTSLVGMLLLHQSKAMHSKSFRQQWSSKAKPLSLQKSFTTHSEQKLCATKGVDIYSGTDCVFTRVHNTGKCRVEMNCLPACFTCCFIVRKFHKLPQRSGK